MLVESSRTGTIILERYMEGPEYSIDAVVYNGTLTVTGFADRHIYYPPYFIETGHTLGKIVVYDETNVALVNTHAERNRGADYIDAVIYEVVLYLVSFLC